MIDELIAVTDTEFQTSFIIREGHLFVINNEFTEPGMIENMAQTAAAGTGWSAVQGNQPAPVGFIGAIKNWQVSRLPRVGDSLLSTIKVQHQIRNAHIVSGTITCQGQLIASAEFTIFLQ